MIITLETEREQIASDQLAQLIARMEENPHAGAILYIRALWDGETWESILQKYHTEGSVWYVWWMDGVRKYLADLEEP